MDKRDVIYEIDGQLQKNADNTDCLQRRLSDIQQEEELYRKDVLSCASSIEGLSQVLKGDVLSKIQSEALCSLDTIKQNVENAFSSEREQIEEGLRSLDGEKKALTQKKNELTEEE